MIKLNNISKSFGRKSILTDINLTLKPNEINIIYGKNGEGKTTLLKCICGLLKPDRGHIDYNDIKINEMGLVLNNSLLIKKLTVKEYLTFICILKKTQEIEINKKIDFYLQELDFYKEKNTLIENLSNGTKSKLSLISSIIYKPKFLILDEPFSGMDISTIDRSCSLIKKLSNEGSIIIISSHKTEIIIDFFDKISILKNGSITMTFEIVDLVKELNDKQISIKNYLNSKI